MTSLGTAIGAMIAQLVQGRSQADSAFIALAKLYQENPILKGFPVPRLIIEEVTVDLKLAIADTPVSTDLTLESRNKIFSEVSMLIINLVKDERNILEAFPHLEKYWPLSTELTIKKISSFLLSVTEIQPVLFSQGMTAIICSELSKAAFANSQLTASQANSYFNKYNAVIEKKLSSSIERLIQAEFNAQPVNPDLLNIKITSEELETIPAEKITTMKFILKEADRDWTQVETSTGEVVNRLIPH